MASQTLSRILLRIILVEGIVDAVHSIWNHLPCRTNYEVRATVTTLMIKMPYLDGRVAARDCPNRQG